MLSGNSFHVALFQCSDDNRGRLIAQAGNRVEQNQAMNIGIKVDR